MFRTLVVVLALSAGAASAQPAVESLSPNSGPTAGGNVVTITGSGFSTCIICSPPTPPDVFFGDFPARSVELLGPNTIRAVAPSQPAGEVLVTVDQFNGRSAPSLNARYTYTGSSADAFVRVLLPIYMPPVRGAFGSEFRTDFRVWNRGGSLARIYGLHNAPSVAVDVGRFSALDAQLSDRPAGPGRFIDIAGESLANLAMNLRAYDVSRDATNFGTEIPVVHEGEFRSTIALTGVPLDPRFRLMLRIYHVGAGNSVYVTFANESRPIAIREPRDANDPGYAELVLIPSPMQVTPPSSLTTATVTVHAPETTTPALPRPRVWAFLTVTNNDTQHITTITPRPAPQ